VWRHHHGYVPHQQPRNDGMQTIMYSVGSHNEKCNKAKTSLHRPVSSSMSRLDQTTPRADEVKKRHCYKVGDWRD
jgi:hypothetical protein